MGDSKKQVNLDIVMNFQRMREIGLSRNVVATSLTTSTTVQEDSGWVRQATLALLHLLLEDSALTSRAGGICGRDSRPCEPSEGPDPLRQAPCLSPTAPPWPGSPGSWYMM